MATTATKNITYDEGRDEVDWWRETWRLNIIAALQKKATPSSAAPVLRLLHRWLALIGVPFWASTSQPARRPRRAAPCRSRRASLFLCLFLDRGRAGASWGARRLGLRAAEMRTCSIGVVFGVV